MAKRAKILPLLVLSFLGACSASNAPSGSADTTPRRNFSAEDKRVARVLSIGGEDRSADVSPQYRAALCSLALESVQDRMQGGGLLTNEQQRIFAQAQSLYKQRATIDLSPEEQEQTLSEVETAYPNQSDRVRFAIGCLRELASL